jgi:hypothetical protein
MFATLHFELCHTTVVGELYQFFDLFNIHCWV